MKNHFFKYVFAAVLLGSTSAYATVDEAIKGHSFEWRWEKGAFKGAGFGVEFKNDGTLVWRGIAGPVLGTTDTEKQYEAAAIAKNIYMVSWAEKSGYVVTIVLNFADQSCRGIVSNKNEWYPLEGKFVEKK